MKAPTFWHSVWLAAEGIVYTVRTQRNMRIHLTILVLVILAGVFFRLTAMEWALVMLVSGLVIALETMNSAVETLADLVHPDYHPQVKVIKDAAAGAVLIAALTAVSVGIAVFGPRVWKVLSGFLALP